jgi:hypothetical protein
MKRFLVVFCSWLVLASASVRVYALAGDLDHPSIALPANAPAELHGQRIRILGDNDAKFLRGHFVNAHTTLEYGGSTEALNRMLAKLAECGGIQIKVRFVRTADGPAWTLDHNAWGDASVTDSAADENRRAIRSSAGHVKRFGFNRTPPGHPARAAGARLAQAEHDGEDSSWLPWPSVAYAFTERLPALIVLADRMIEAQQPCGFTCRWMALSNHPGADCKQIASNSCHG